MLLKLLRGLGKWRRYVLAGVDSVMFAVIALLYWTGTEYFSLAVRYPERWKFFAVMGVLLVCDIICHTLLRTYRSMWRYPNTVAYLKLIAGYAVGSICAFVVARIIGIYNDVWSIVTVASISALAALSLRFVYRIAYKRWKLATGNELHKIPVAIVGAGQIGALLAEELMARPTSDYNPIFFIDQDKSKSGSRIAGLNIYHEDEQTMELIRRSEISEIFIAIKGLEGPALQELYDRYRATGCKVKYYDTPMQEDGTESTKGVLREIKIEDLLFREPLDINGDSAFAYYKGKTVLVTGGGGSIGSELCRQIAKCSPAHLIIVDIYENNAYDIQQELIRTYKGALPLTVEIASVRDRARMDTIFRAYRPQIVFHAAAHKHVPLMEHSGCEVIKNNVLGTYNTADMAEKYGAEKFILISTDKAVNPTNLMGASKRMCEMVVQCRTDSKTSFAAVRFGNVLGSNGSVIPLFRKQIETGGPITITDKRIIRYFMTIPEASQLVIRAGAMAKRGELFVLDMGKPVKIYDLAVNMIRLCGLVPDVDIQIEEIGLRPGEKLYEELLIKTESLEKTDNDMIFVEKDAPLTRAEVGAKIDLLCAAVEASKDEIESPKIREAMHKAVPTFKEPEEINKDAAKSAEMQIVSA